MRSVSDLTSWGSDWKGLKVAVFGLGVTGFSVADTLAELECQVLVVADKADPELLDILGVIGVESLISRPFTDTEAALNGFAPDLVVTSPGFRPDSELISWANSHSVPVWVDIELAWRINDKAALANGTAPSKWICITGTNGKTTTAQLTEAMLNSAGIRAVACGNIGVPILDAVRDPIGFEALVVELSSFQLHYLGDISPYSSAVLNLADDHLDWHGGFENYVAAKGKIYENVQNSCVFNKQDAATQALVENANVIEGARAIGFTLAIPARSEIGYVEDILCDRAYLEDRANSALEIASLAEISSIGVITPHLLSNIAAATALARSMDAAPAAIKNALLNFKLDAHRIELVAEADGISWYDDSKATNPHAAAASLASFDRVVWIVGGLLKGVDLGDLVEKFATKIKAAIVIGKERQPVLDALAKFGPAIEVFEIVEEENSSVMRSAVRIAAEIATASDTVLLAPAAASMDQFKDYADRGKQFAQAVQQQLGNQSGVADG